MTEQKNLCALIPIDLHDRVSQAKDQAGQTTGQYITGLLTEYFEMKENGGRALKREREKKIATGHKPDDREDYVGSNMNM